MFRDNQLHRKQKETCSQRVFWHLGMPLTVVCVGMCECYSTVPCIPVSVSASKPVQRWVCSCVTVTFWVFGPYLSPPPLFFSPRGLSTWHFLSPLWQSLWHPICFFSLCMWAHTRSCIFTVTWLCMPYLSAKPSPGLLLYQTCFSALHFDWNAQSLCA